MRTNQIVEFRPEGLYCAAGNFFIDPMRPVDHAVITHGHGDHARSGSGTYYAARAGLPILQWRLGEQDYRVFDYGQRFKVGDVWLSLHSAGHVLGSAQVRIEVGDRVWVVSGDYKRQPDPTCEPFEVVPCDVFVTECTFGLPVYRWTDTSAIAGEILQWKQTCASRGETAVLLCYALGKAQRLLAELGRLSDEPAFTHGAVENGVQVYRAAGIAMLPTIPVMDAAAPKTFEGQLVLAPPSAAGSAWMKRFRHSQLGFASGWMQIRGNRRRRNYDRGFVVSDHADWPSLVDTIGATGAPDVIAMHGNTDALVRYLNENGTHAGTFERTWQESE